MLGIQHTRKPRAGEESWVATERNVKSLHFGRKSVAREDHQSSAGPNCPAGVGHSHGYHLSGMQQLKEVGMVMDTGPCQHIDDFGSLTAKNQ